MKYEKATFEIIEISSEDIIKTSGSSNGSESEMRCSYCGGTDHFYCGPMFD